MKSMIRKAIRTIIKAKEYETVNSAIDRHIIYFEKRLRRGSISIKEVENELKNIGITEGDVIMVHSSWRQFYNYEGTPDDFIKSIRKLIGEEGTLLMPCYGVDRTYLDVSTTPTSAGVVSEVFRNYKDVVRSSCTHFSVAAQGPLAYELTKDHINSEYGFDYNSPYYKLTKLEKAKVLFVGLGAKPTKISLFHCAGYILKDKNVFLKKIISHRYISKLVVDGIEYSKEMVIRKPGHGNNNKNFRKILREIENKKQSKIKNIDLVIIDAKEGLQRAIEYAKKGIYCYKK